MKRFFQQNKAALGLYLFFLLLGVIVLISSPKAAIHLSINQWHAPFFDGLFKYMTLLGSWGVGVLFLLLLIRYKREAIIFLIGNLVITLLVQGLKHLVFPGTLRPVAYFKGIHILHLIPGEAMHFYNSFPSGHSASAFGIFIILIYLTKNSWLKIGWLLLAFLIAFSRVYLSQHFLEDILAGSFIGLIGMGFTLYIFDHFYPTAFSSRPKNR